MAIHSRICNQKKDALPGGGTRFCWLDRLNTDSNLRSYEDADLFPANEHAEEILV